MRSIVGFLMLAAYGCAGAGAGVSASSAGATAKLCAAFQTKLDAIQKDAGFPGATAALTLENGDMCIAASGLADREETTPMRADHRMPAGSIGKTFVAAAALSLIEDGVLTYDTKAAAWLGQYSWFADWPNAQTITLGDLLTHTSGVAIDYFEQPEMLARLIETVEKKTTLNALGVTHHDYAAAVSGTAPAFAAGEGFHYSDVSYVLAALIVEEASGATLENIIDERFLAPLALTATAPQARVMEDIAAGYIPAPYRAAFGGVPEKSLDDDGVFAYDPAFEWGGGGYVSTAGDLARWARAWFGGSALPGDYLDIQRMYIDMRAMDTLQAGYGPGVQFLPDTEFGDRYFHRGYMLGYISVTDYLPEYDVSVSLMINTIDTGYTSYHNDLVRIVIDELGVQ